MFAAQRQVIGFCLLLLVVMFSSIAFSVAGLMYVSLVIGTVGPVALIGAVRPQMHGVA
jgi:hypothetical protein